MTKKCKKCKGYDDGSVAAKVKLARAHGYDIKVLYKEDLKLCFDYVEKTYKTKKFYELYDNYKPKI